MKKINMPGYTAVESLYKSGARYRMNIDNQIGIEVNILPQLKIQTTRANGGKLELCMQIGELINDAVNEGLAASNQGERAAWLELAGQIAVQSRARHGCGFGVSR